jgi:hypothetical protein
VDFVALKIGELLAGDNAPVRTVRRMASAEAVKVREKKGLNICFDARRRTLERSSVSRMLPDDNGAVEGELAFSRTVCCSVVVTLARDVGLSL